MGSITDFIGSLANGVARPNKYQIIVSPPSKIIDQREGFRTMMFTTEVAAVPGRTVQTVEHKHYGLPKHIALQAVHPEISIQIMLTGTWVQHRVLMEWQDIAVGGYRKTRQNPNQALTAVGYHDDYVGTVDIMVYRDGEETQPQLTVTLHEAFPTQVTEVGLNWAEENSFARQNVQFMYRYTTEKYYEPVNNSPDNDLVRERQIRVNRAQPTALLGDIDNTE